MTTGIKEHVVAPSVISSEHLSILGKYPDIALLLAAIGICIAIWVSQGVQKWHQRWMKHLKFASKLSGPPALPLLGNALQFACSADELLNRLVDVCTRYVTPFRFWLGPKLAVILTEPSDVEVILNSSKAACKGSVYRCMEPFLGRGLLTGSGPTHKAHRRAIMPMLNGKVLATYVQYFDQQSMCCADRMEEFVDAGEFDLAHLMEHCTIDIILDTIMGTSGTVQQEGYKLLTEWTAKMYKLIHSRMMKVWLQPDWIFALTNFSEEQYTAQQVINGFTEGLIARKRKEHQALERGFVTSDRPRLMLLEQLIAHVEKTNLMDDVQLRDEIYTIFTAAQDTSAVISCFAFLMLGMHPEIQDRIRTELSEVLGDRNVTAEDLSELKYLEMVIKETIRLFPIAPVMVRELKGDIELETCTLPEGCSVVMVPYLTHRDPKYWLNPNKFDPSRFTAENSTGRHPYAYIPFSAGMRGCVGQKYAMMCLKTIVANVVRRYRLACSTSYEELRLKTDISIRSVNGYKVSITKV